MEFVITGTPFDELDLNETDFTATKPTMRAAKLEAKRLCNELFDIVIKDKEGNNLAVWVACHTRHREGCGYSGKWI